MVDEAVWCPPSGRLVRARAAIRLLSWGTLNRGTLAAVHANGVSDLHLVAPLALVSRRPVVVWVHEARVGGRGLRLFRLWARILPALHVRYVSAPQMAAVGVVARRGSTGVTPNPIDPTDVVAPRAGPAGDVPAVGFLGTPATYKGFHLLPALVAGTGRAVAWHVFAGPRTMLPDTWRALEAIPSVELHGKVRDVAAAYATLDVVACPSLEESFGRVVAEAMANGLPVVAFALPALAELVEDGQDGVLVEVGDVAAMSAAIVGLAADAGLRRTLGERARRRAEAFAPAAIAASLERLYVGGA